MNRSKKMHSTLCRNTKKKNAFCIMQKFEKMHFLACGGNMPALFILQKSHKSLLRYAEISANAFFIIEKTQKIYFTLYNRPEFHFMLFKLENRWKNNRSHAALFCRHCIDTFLFLISIIYHLSTSLFYFLISQ